MKKLFSILFVVVMSLTSLLALGACGDNAANDDNDYVALTKFDADSGRISMQVDSVYMFIDGDTTHFNVPQEEKKNFPTGIFKARYLGVDTPESTGAIEAWGKQASNFTKSKLQNAHAIIVESNSSKWEGDSTTSGRTLAWVWYQPNEGDEFRLLNLELLAQGLAKRKDVDGSPYENVNALANRQAMAKELHLHSSERDPLYWYEGAQEIDLKELRINMSDYEGTKVGFTGTIVYADDSQGLYVQEWDEVDKRYYGIYVYYGFSLKTGLQHLVPGNKIHFIGTVTNFNGSWQVSDIKYFSSGFGGSDEAEQRGSFKVVSKNNEIVYTELTGAQFHSDVTIDINAEGEQKTYKFYELALGTAVTFKGLKVVDTYQTIDKETAYPEGITLTCQTADGKTVEIRTATLIDKDGTIDSAHIFKEEGSSSAGIVLKTYFADKTIDVSGFVDYYEYNGNGQYQVEVSALADIIVK